MKPKASTRPVKTVFTTNRQPKKLFYLYEDRGGFWHMVDRFAAEKEAIKRMEHGKRYTITTIYEA